MLLNAIRLRSRAEFATFIRRARAMEIAIKSEHDFLAVPRLGGFVGGPVAAWCVDDELQGYAVWGTFTADVARRVFFIANAVRGATKKTLQRKVVISLNRLTSVDWEGVEEVMRLRKATHEDATTQGVALFEAVVRPQGIVGAIVAGAYEMFIATKRQSVHPDLNAALAWLGRDSDADAVSTFLEKASSLRSGIVEELRNYLTTNLVEGSLAEAARALGVASRTLQLELAKEGSGFRAIRDEVRFHEAKARLKHSEDKIEHIAGQLGFRSPRHFYKWFHHHAGVSPGAWRQR